MLVEETAKQYPGQTEELQRLLVQYLSLPGTVWDGGVAREFLDGSQKQQSQEELRELRLAQEREAEAIERAETAGRLAARESRLKWWAFRAAGMALFLMVLAIGVSFLASNRKAASDENARLANEKKKEADTYSKRAEKSEKAEKARADELREQVAESERRLDLTRLREAQFAMEHNNLELVEDFLDGVNPKHRCFVWNCLKRRSIGGLFTLYGHASDVTSAAFSPDGLRIVTGSWDQTARVGDAKTGLPIWNTAIPETVDPKFMSPDKKISRVASIQESPCRSAQRLSAGAKTTEGPDTPPTGLAQDGSEAAQ